MCGICGVYEFGAAAPAVSEAVVNRMRDTLEHRGPDDCGSYISPDRTVGLGHRRLSIIDLSPAGRQPMTNEDESLWITFNGEIWNHNCLRRDLAARGHRFRSRTDTESILHLYEERGTDAISELDGMFAWALWDGQKRRLILARDRTGKKPLFYTTVNGKFIFGSELRSLLAHPEVRREVDEEGLSHYLTFVGTPAPHTLLKNVRKLPAGHYMVVDANGPHQSQAYWEPIVAFPKRPPSESEAIERVGELLGKAVNKRLMSDVPVGAFLSGGVDSSAIVALMSRHMSHRMQTFSAGFEGFDSSRNFHDLPYAREVAKAVGTDHHEIILSSADIEEYLLEMPHLQDEPINDPCVIAQHHISKAAKSAGITVMLAGEGSDEIFCGYGDYLKAEATHGGKWRQLTSVPKPLLRCAAGALRMTGAYPGRLDVLRRAAAGRELFWGLEIGFWDTEKEKVLSPKGMREIMRHDSHDVVAGTLETFRRRVQGRTYLDDLTYLEMKIRLPEFLLRRVDRITMTSAIEARVPFLDTELVEYALQIPPEMRARGGVTKYVLKRALEDVIPSSILDRPKQGFRVPLPEWFREDLVGLISRVLLGSSIHDRGWFNRRALENMIEAHKTRKGDLSYKMWNLFILFAWYDAWISGKPVAA